MSKRRTPVLPRTIRRSGDSGQSLVLMIMMSVLIMLLLSTAMSTLTTQVRPARITLDDGVALAAAEAGLEDFSAKMNANCGTVTFSCTWPSGGDRYNNLSGYTTPTTSRGARVTGADGTQGPGSYFWYVVTPTSAYSSTPSRRVVSIGQVPTSNSATSFRLKYLIADIDGINGVGDFLYYTKYESYAPDFLTNFYAPRTIGITADTALANTSLDSSYYTPTRNSYRAGTGAKLVWDGVCDRTTAGCDPNHDVGICDDLFYNLTDPTKGRGNDAAWNNAARRPAAGNFSTPDAITGPDATTQAWLGTADGGVSQNGEGNRFAYYREGGRYYTSSSDTTGISIAHNDTCDSTMEPNMVMNGPVYSQDAYLIDRGKPTGSSCNSEPNFSKPSYTLFNGMVNSTTQANPYSHPTNLGHDRVYPIPSGITGAGQPGEACLVGALTTPWPTTVSGASGTFNLPPDASDAIPTCTYVGPTRIKIVNNIAYVTAPGGVTGANPPFCSTSTNPSFSNGASAYTASGGGVFMAQVPLNRAVIYVKNPTSGPAPARATDSVPIFNYTSGMPANTSSNSLVMAFADATYSAATPCPLAPVDPTKRRNFDCETGQLTPAEDVYSNLSSTAPSSPIRTYLESGVPTASGLQGKIVSMLKSGITTAPTAGNWTASSFYYTVTVAAATNDPGDVNADENNPTAPTDLTPDDPFLQHVQGRYHTTTTKWTVTIARVTCAALSGGNCTTTSSRNIVTGSVKSVAHTAIAGTQPDSSLSFPWTDSRFTASQCPNKGADNAYCRDVTEYDNGYGDAYVEGTLQGQASIIAEHDVIVTNDIKYSNRTFTSTTDGMSIVATHNVRIYRPLTCVDSDPPGVSTTVGFCPNDTTGIYAPVDFSYPPPANFYSQEYKTCRQMGGSAANCPPAMADGDVLDATVFALRGSFIADNYFRGYVDNGQGGMGITITGGLYQYHRGATSMPYQGRPYQGSNKKMPGISITYDYDNMRVGGTATGGLRVPYLPPVTSASGGNNLNGHTWNIVSVSTMCPGVAAGTPCS